MLDLFRKRGLSSVVYGAVIIATILVFVIQFRPNAGQKQASLKEACAAKVKGYCIDPNEQRAAYRLLTPRDQDGAPSQARARSMGLSKITIDGLVERELLVDEADRLGLTVTDDEITDSIYGGWIHVSVPSDNPSLAYSLRIDSGRLYAGFRDPKTKQFDVKVYERTVRNLMGRSPQEFREEQAREILAAKMREQIKASVRVSEAEALDLYLGQKSSASLTYVPVKQSYVARWAVRPSQADVDAWLKDKANADLVDTTVKSRKEDDTPKAGHIRHILIKTASPSDDELGAALAKLAQAKARIDAGELFADVARDVSDDKGSAMRGGDVGDKTDPFVTPFKNAADALKPGEMTKTAIQTQFGLHLIMKDDPSKTADLDAAIRRDAARDLYLKSKTLDASKDFAAKIAASMKAGKSADDAIAAAIATLPKLPASGQAPLTITLDKPASDADAGAAGDGGAEGKKAPLAKPLTADTDPDRPQAKTSSAFNRGGDPIPDLSGDASAQVTKFAFAEKEGAVMPEPLRTDDGFVVVQLKEHKAATKDEFQKEKDAFLQTLLAPKQAEALALYVKRLREQAKGEIKVDEAYLIDGKPGTDGGAPPPGSFDEEEEP